MEWWWGIIEQDFQVGILIVNLETQIAHGLWKSANWNIFCSDVNGYIRENFNFFLIFTGTRSKEILLLTVLNFLWLILSTIKAEYFRSYFLRRQIFFVTILAFFEWLPANLGLLGLFCSGNMEFLLFIRLRHLMGATLIMKANVR